MVVWKGLVIAKGGGKVKCKEKVSVSEIRDDGVKIKEKTSIFFNGCKRKIGVHGIEWREWKWE